MRECPFLAATAEAVSVQFKAGLEQLPEDKL